jgi:hypothetical protein
MLRNSWTTHVEGLAELDVSVRRFQTSVLGLNLPERIAEAQALGRSLHYHLDQLRHPALGCMGSLHTADTACRTYWALN